MNTFPARTWSAGWRLLRSAGLALATGSLLLTATLSQAAPASGSVIGNQASATYTDASSTVQSATSNLVQTVVQQVGAFTLSGTAARTAAPGGTAYMAYTLTNTGNGTDTFTLRLTNNSGSFEFSALAIYLDADGNGMPDSTTALVSGTSSFTTPSVAAGSAYRFVVALSVPNTASNDNTDNVTVTAGAGTPGLYTTTTATGTSTVTVATGVPVFSVSKSVSLSQGSASAASCTGTDYSGLGCQLVTYTLAYTNNGTAAGPLYLRDVIGTGATAGMLYVAGSARWNTSNTLTDTAGGDPSGIDFQAVTVSPTTTLQAVVASVPVGGSGTVTFQVGIRSTATVGIGSTNNSADFATATNTTVASGMPGTTQPTNAAAYTVSARYGVVANNSSTVTSDQTLDNEATGFNLVTASIAYPGTRIDFTPVYYWNTGNASDTFNIVITNPSSLFPTGSVWSAVRADGTPFADSNGDGIIDTGPLAAGASMPVHVRVSIPANACASITCPSASVMTLHVQAVSVGSGSTVTNKAYTQLSIGGLRAPGVTLTATATSSGSPSVPTLATNAGTSASFDLVVTNSVTGAPADTYDLLFSTTNFNAGTVPAGWAISYRSGTCASAGSVITSTGSLAGAASSNVCAVVTTGSSAAAGEQLLYFRAASVNTGAVATLQVRVTVNAQGGLSLTTNNAGQVAAGGVLSYAHTLTNTGNVACTALSFTLNQTLSTQGWAAVVYSDANDNGALDANEPVVASPFTTPLDTLAPGTSRRFIVRVFAPGGAAVGAIDLVTFTVTGTCGSATSAAAQDRTTVMSGQLRLVKTQAIDAGCDGAADATPGITQVNAQPDQCVIYTVVATNLGVTAVSSVSILDATPAYTRLRASGTNATPTCSAGSLNHPGLGSAGTVSCTGIASLAAGASVTLVFAVRIDP